MTRRLSPLQWQWLGTVPYREAWRLQRALAALRAAGEIGDCVLLLEHPPVYTAGRNTERAHLKGSPDHLRALGAEYIEVDRGGSITFHGPGQLVAYPIVKLCDVFPLRDTPEQGDVIRYLRTLEDALERTASRFGIACGPRPPYTGVWSGDRKLAAIGVKLAAGGVTTHGVGLNVDTNLSWFDHVIPCGIPELGVGSLAGEGALGLGPQDVAPVFAAEVARTQHRTVTPPQRDLLKAVENALFQPTSATS